MRAAGVHIAYIDDVERDLKDYSERLEGAGDIKVSQFLPRRGETDVSKIVSEIRKSKPDLALVDIRLQNTATYGGSGLGGELLQKYPDYPIVLLTDVKRTRESGSGSFWDISTGFDDLLDKGEIAENAKAEAQRLASLALGYRKLREADPRDLDALLGAMGAREDERPPVTEAGPPIGRKSGKGVPAAEQRHSERHTWGVVAAARWIRNVVLSYPGIVYDRVHTATLLGISVSSFDESDVQGMLQGARYDGVFAPPEGRWWRRRLLTSAAALMQEQGVSTPVTHGFREAFKQHTGTKLEPAVCNYCGKPSADIVCCVLNEPVMTECSLPYGQNQGSLVMDEARVSLKAVRQSNDFQLELLTPEAQEIAREMFDAGSESS